MHWECHAGDVTRFIGGQEQTALLMSSGVTRASRAAWLLPLPPCRTGHECDLAVHPNHDILHLIDFGRSPKHVAQAMSSRIATNPSRPQSCLAADGDVPFIMGAAKR